MSLQMKVVAGSKVKVLPDSKLKVVVSGSAYFLQRAVNPIEGGSEITFTLTTSNVPDGTNVDYTITNVSPSDVISGNLNGSFLVNNNTATTTLEVALEPESPNVNSATLTLNNNQASVSVFPPPTYTLTRSAVSIDEGSSVTFTLTTTGVANGTNVPYSISGISVEDLSSGSLTGNFVINGGTASITLTAANDSLTEGSETITITAEGQTSTTTINDTSTTPVSPTYSLTRSAVSVDEGSAITFTLTTTNVANGTNVAYTITGISVEDLSTGSLTGNFVVNNNTASITLIAYDDSLTEGTETMTITAAGQTTSVAINDTSYAITGPAETVLLLNANGTAVYGDTFVDSSSNKFTITKSGSPIIRNFGPFSGGTGRSISFDGGSTLTTPNFTWSSGDFTIETWVNFNNINNASGVFSPNNQYIFDTGSGNMTRLQVIGGSLEFSLNGTLVISHALNPVVGVWYHIAVSRQSNTVKMFVNGTSVGTPATFSDTPSAGIIVIGNTLYNGGAYNAFLNGYLSNFRIVNGTAVYTTDFTPATAALTNVSGTSLLLNSGTVNKADNDLFLDTSSNRFIINKSGSPTLATLSPFATSKRSISFNGSGDYLTRAFTSTSDGMYLGGTTYTIEAWVYMNSIAGIQTVYNCSSTNTINFGELSLLINAGVLSFVIRPTVGGSATFISGGSIIANTWNHIAISVNATSGKLFLNGTQVGSTTTIPTALFTPVGAGIGRFGNQWQDATDFNGYISNLRIVKGTAVYTSNFTPPTSPVTNITNTSLLLHAQPGIIDSSEKNPVIYTEGNSVMNTSIKKYGTGSLYFDGNGDYLTIPASSNLTLGTGNFTVEGWVYKLSNTGEIFVSNADSTTNNNYYTIGVNNDGSAQFQIRNSTGNQFFVTSLTNTVSSNVWTHIAAVRDSGTMKLFVNGTQVGTPLANSTDISQRNTIVGAFLYPGFTNYFNGYVDDLRITKNLARYTSNFTPPTQQLTINV